MNIYFYPSKEDDGADACENEMQPCKWNAALWPCEWNAALWMKWNATMLRKCSLA